MPASLSSLTCWEHISLGFMIIWWRNGFSSALPSFLSKSMVGWTLLLVGRPTTARVPYDNHPSVMSLTVVIFRVSVAHVLNVACQKGWTPLTRQRTSCGNEKGWTRSHVYWIGLEFPRSSPPLENLLEIEIDTISVGIQFSITNIKKKKEYILWSK